MCAQVPWPHQDAEALRTNGKGGYWKIDPKYLCAPVDLMDRDTANNKKIKISNKNKR